MKTYPESRLTDLLIEFDEMGFCPTTVCPHPEQTAIEWKEQIVKEIQSLQAENAELRARLECSIEFPCKVGDTIYYINPYKEQPKIDEFKVRSLCKDNFYGKMIYIDNGEFFFVKTDGLFFTRAEAEARLKELKG